MNPPFRILAAALLVLAPLAAQAERYRVDMILFADRSAPTSEASVPLVQPNLSSAIEAYDTAKLKAAGIEILPDESFGLTQQWAHLKNSRNHSPLLRLAYLQKDPPADNGIAIHLHTGEPFNRMMQSGSQSQGVYPVDGSIALLAERFLHVEAEFISTQDVSGELRSYRLKERRRVKRDELHHLDSPRLGLLVRVQRVDESGAVKAVPKPQGKPAAPKPAPKKK